MNYKAAIAFFVAQNVIKSCLGNDSSECNGVFYKVTADEARTASGGTTTWDDYRLACQARGDDLASLHCGHDAELACEACNESVCYIGGYQTGGEGSTGYSNVDNTPMDWVPTNWDGWSSPNEDVLAIQSSDCSIHDYGVRGDDWVAKIGEAASAICRVAATEVGAFGDPHIKTWTGEQFDFHGICDLVLVSNPEFFNGAGLDVHIRNKKMRQWSYVDSAAVRIGKDILEVRGGKKKNVWINGIESNDNMEKLSIAGFPIQYYPISKKSEKFVVDLGNDEGIVLKTWNSFLSVTIENPQNDKFAGSVGLMGSFPEGTKIGRGNSIVDDNNVFGQEWQVLSSEQNLFHEIEGPQHPQQCEIPSSTEMRRRLAASIVTVVDAEKACIGVGQKDKELCIFDVMATNDQSSAGAY
jgi:hypothetical protein